MWSENTLYDFGYFKFGKVYFKLKIWSIFVYVSWALGKNMYTAVFVWHVL